MKNFSTVMTRAAGAALVACVVAGPVQAAQCAFKPNAPDQHVVVKRDTLWDISGKFLEHPWCWPQVWGMNRDQIRNPHWIYPGQIVYFDRKHGRLTLNKPGDGDGRDPGLTRLSPQVRSEGLQPDAIDAIPTGAIEPYLTQPLVIEQDTLAGAPRIAAAQEGRVYLGSGDRVYVRGDLHGATEFQVFRPTGPLRDPVTKAVLAHEATYLGTVKLVKAAVPGVDVHTFTVTESLREIGVGDRLVPVPTPAVRNYMPHAAAAGINARVMSIYSGESFAGQSQVVTVNKGSFDGLDVGSVLQLYHFGKRVADPGGKKGFLGMGGATMKLPDEQYGSLFIFRVFGRVSYGLIMQVTEPAQVGDVAKTPE